MPFYDCVLLLKPSLKKEVAIDLLVRVGKHVLARNGVLTDVKSFGTVQLGYGIKKLDGRYFQGQLMQMTMMATPNINKELHYLNKEDRLLRWILVKHRDVKFGLSDFGYSGKSLFDADWDNDDPGESGSFRRGIFNSDDDDDDTDSEEDDNDEYEVEGDGETVELGESSLVIDKDVGH